MAQIKVRMLVDHADADGKYPCNSLQALDDEKAKLFCATGLADASKGAVAFAEKAAAKAAAKAEDAE